MTYFFLKVLVIILMTAILALAQQSKADPASYYAEGAKLYGEGKLAQAIDPLQKAATLDPNNAEYLYGLGVCYFETERFEEALSVFRRFSELKPGAVAFNQVGTTLVALDRYREAVDFYEKALKYEPNDPTVLRNAGIASVWLKKYKDAIKMLEHARSMGKDDSDLTGHLGVAYTYSGHYKKALAEFQKLSRLRPDDAEAKYALAAVYGAMGDRSAAMDQQKRVESLDPQLGRKLFRQLFSGQVIAADEFSKPK